MNKSNSKPGIQWEQQKICVWNHADLQGKEIAYNKVLYSPR